MGGGFFFLDFFLKFFFSPNDFLAQTPKNPVFGFSFPRQKPFCGGGRVALHYKDGKKFGGESPPGPLGVIKKIFLNFLKKHSPGRFCCLAL